MVQVTRQRKSPVAQDNKSLQLSLDIPTFKISLQFLAKPKVATKLQSSGRQCDNKDNELI